MAKGAPKGYCNPGIYKYWKGKSGALHNLSRPVMTPFGAFGSMSEAARALGVRYYAVWQKVKRGSDGYDNGYFWL